MVVSVIAAMATQANEVGSKDRWDAGHSYVSRNADNLANWLDGFFGDEDTEAEAPYSTLRLRLGQRWLDGEGMEQELSLRGNIHLPKLSERLSLLFSGSQDETPLDELAVEERSEADDVSLQYTLQEERNHRLDLRFGLRTSGHPKAALRYRYDRTINPIWSTRFVERLRYYGEDGIDALTQFEMEKTLSSSRVARWSNRVFWSEQASGVKWRSSLANDKRLSDQRAVSYFVFTQGTTQPNGDVDSYGLGVRYRQNLFKPWLFVDLQPTYQWRIPDETRNREGVAGILLRFNVVFEQQPED